MSSEPVQHAESVAVVEDALKTLAWDHFPREHRDGDV